jgi:hypothetical protein
MSVEILLIAALVTKHFIADFILQYPYQFLNKGTYGHPGGLLHMAITGIGSLIACALVITITPMVLAIIGAEMVIHYHLDWAKVQINSHFKWSPTSHSEFWNLLGLDQWLHYMTYIVMVALMVAK